MARKNRLDETRGDTDGDSSEDLIEEEESNSDGDDDAAEEVESSSNSGQGELDHDNYLGTGSSDEAEDEEDEDDEDEGEEMTVIQSTLQSKIKSTEPCSFDVRNLVAMNSHGVSDAKLYKPKDRDSSNDDRVTIGHTTLSMMVQEDFLLEKATDGCNQLLSVLWQLPVEMSDAGPLGTLPRFDELPLPRSLPPPPPKQLTKWEKFAKEKGIPLNKSKRSRKVWDEATNSWKYRHGYEKANDDSKEWPIMEVKANQDPYEDPWERARDEKKAKRERNQENRTKNMERSGALPKGTAKSISKQRAAAREVDKAGGNKDRDSLHQPGIPVDLKPSKNSGASTSSAKRGKESTVASLVAAQTSTASLGRFDKMREGEPERKRASVNTKKRKYESGSDRKVLQTESERSMKLLKTVVEGGGVAKEKARKKGHLAHGETGYDYDYDDGLGASSFRKKKGRAGAGKTKKMTKKRIK